MEKKKTVAYLLDVQLSTGKSSQDSQTLQTPMKSNIFSIGFYVWLFLLDFLKTEIAC